jgi:uncharacterized protein YcfJ
MKKLKTMVIATTTMMSILTSISATANSYYDYATVIKAKPVYEYQRIAQPIQQCYPVQSNNRHQHRHNHDRAGATIAGAVIGGVIGKVIGNSRESTVVGAVIGGAIGNSQGNQHRTKRHINRSQQHCETVYTAAKKVRKLKGYNVKYRYQGEAYKTFMRRHPGDSVKVRVSLSPVGYD